MISLGWTDGAKVVLDTLCIWQASDFNPSVTVIHCSVLDLENQIEHHPYKYTTFYVVANQDAVEHLQAQFPSMSIRRYWNSRP